MAETAHTGRIAYLTSHYPAVSHTFVLREVEALRALGLDVQTCSIRRHGGDHERGAAEAKAASETYYIQTEARRIWPLIAAQKRLFTQPRRYLAALALAWRTRAPGLKALIYQIFYFAEATLMARRMETEGLTHLHSHFAQTSTTIAMLTSALTGRAYSYTLHGPADLFEPHRWRLDAKTARATFVSCISHFARSQAMFFSDPVHWDKLHIVHCGVDPALYDRPAPPPSEGLRLVFVGRLSPVKGLRVLLEALPAALKEVPDLHLTIVGDGEDRAHLEALAAPLGDRVVFTGYRSQDEVAAHLAQADVLVLPSFAEGLPVVLMEALASRRPVICTQVAGVGELVENGVSGLIVPPGDAGSLTRAIVELARDRAARVRMGKAGRAKVVAEFDAAKEAEKLLTLFTASPSNDDPAQTKANR